MFHQKTPQSDNVAEEAAIPTGLTATYCTNSEFFKTKDCADNDPSIPAFKRLLIEANKDMDCLPRHPQREEISITSSAASVLPFKAPNARPAIQAADSPETSSTTLSFAGISHKSLYHTRLLACTRNQGQAQQPPNAMASKYIETWNLPPQITRVYLHGSPMESVKQMHVSRFSSGQSAPVFKSDHMLTAGPQKVTFTSECWLRDVFVSSQDFGLAARAVRFIRNHPDLDYRFKYSNPDVNKVLELAQQREYFELDDHVWTALPLTQFPFPDPENSSPFACVVRYAKSPLVNGWAWRDSEVHVKAILRYKLNATGHILLRELDLVGIQRAKSLPPRAIQITHYAQSRGQREKLWTVEDMGTLEQELRLAAVQVSA